MKRSLIWLRMFQKRLFYHAGFIVLLALIPVLVTVMSVFVKQDSAVLSVGLLAQSPTDSVATEIVESLLKEDTIINFYRYTSQEKMRVDMENNRLDAAWIFPSDLSQRMERYGEGNIKLVTVWEKDNDITMNLSREKLYGALFPYVSYTLYKNYIRNGLLDESQADEATLKQYYSKVINDGSLVHTEYYGNGEKRRENYLMTPMRGLLGVLVLLCGFAGMMYHLQDSRAGVYDWLPTRKRLLPAVANILISVFDAIVAMMIALACTGLIRGWTDIPNILLFGLCGTAFCLLVGLLCRKETVLAAIAPVLLILMIIVCPVFVSINTLSVFRPIFPLYYYLYAEDNMRFWLFAVIYAVAIFTLIWGAELIKSRCLRAIGKA